MTRWSLRRRLGGTQNAEREYQPNQAAPPAGRPQTHSPAGQSPTPASVGQPSSGQSSGNWFEPDRARQGQSGSPQPGVDRYGASETGTGTGQYGPGQNGTSQYETSRQYATSQPLGGVGLLTVAQPPPPAQPAPVAQPPAPAAATATGRDARAEPGGQTESPRPSAWPDICDQFGLHLLVLAEQLRTSLDELESDEDDPERLRRLYQVDHAVTRMRRASRDLRTLAGRSEEELAGFTTSLLDVIRMASSAIERYTQVTVGRVTDLAVLGYAADDVGSLMAALLDNATRYSPGTVTVSGHLLEDGGVMFRIEDSGIGIGADQVAALNTAFAGPVPEVDERTGRHTGFPVVHRIARKHSIGVRLAARPLPSSGTVAMVTLPPHLLCEVPADEAQRRPAPATGPSTASSASRPSAVPDLPRSESTRPQAWEPPELPADQPRLPGELPRRERASLRGDEPRPQRREPAVLPTPEQQAAARRAFADELSAFSLGTVGSPDSADNPGDDSSPEEEA